MELPSGVPAQAPKGSASLHVTVATVVVEGGFADMSRAARRIFGPLEGRRASVADLYTAAAALERAYTNAGYLLARVAVPRQSILDGGQFHVVVIDGFIEQIDDAAVPRRVRRPIHAILAGLVGRHRLKADLLQAKLARAGAVFGAHLRSTLARGDTPGGARLILDGRYSEFGGDISADNTLGPAFNHWGLSVTAQVNSPTGHGEQAYVFLSGGTRLDTDFAANAPRRIIGGGVIVPLTSWGLQVNPEFTFSDTHPVPTNPLLASHDRLYRGTLNVTFPVPLGKPGSTTGRITTEVVDELNTLPVFGVVLSHDRLTVLRGALTWDGALQLTSTGLHAEGVLSEGVTWFGARGHATVASPTSRGSDPRFTKLEVTLGATQSLPYGASLMLTGRGQTSFDRVLPSSETFDLTGHTALSSYTQGALVSDAGLTERAQLERTWIRRFGRLGLASTPYVFVSAGQAVPAAPDAFTPRRVFDYGLGLRLDTSGFPWMSAPSVSLEYGHASPDRGLAPRDYVQAVLGVQF